MAEALNTISDLAKGLGFGEKSLHAIEKHVQDRSTSRMLAVLRAKADLSQKEMATKMGVSQSAVSKLENATNDCISFAEAGRYFAALGYEMTVHVSRPKTIVERIKGAYIHLTKLVEDFQGCRRNDPDILLGMAKFETEAAKNMINLASMLIDSSSSKLAQVEVLTEPRILVDDQELDYSSASREHALV